MPGCAVLNCPNKHHKTRGTITYHRFPTNEEIRKSWLDKCGRCENFDCSRSRVCSNHFAEEDFERDLQGELLGQPLKKRLKKGAEPHLNLMKIKEEPIDVDDYEEKIATPPKFTVLQEPVIYGLNKGKLDSSDFTNPASNENNLDADACLVEKLREISAGIRVPQIAQTCTVINVHHIPSSLPASQDWPGEYGFNVSFGRQEKNTKGVAWTYSKIKDKLYVGKDAPCPINFSTNIVMPDDVSIRAMALYSSPEQVSEVVQRCVNHSMEELRRGVFEAEHLIRCESGVATYKRDETTGRHSVVVPFENPPVGQHFSTYIFKFACFGSCAGGPNRRPLMVVFTLERKNKVIGRKKLDVKICACPGRDRKTEEQQIGETEISTSVKRKEPCGLVSLADTLEFTKSVSFPPPKRTKVSPNKDGYYTIQVDNTGCYEFLLQMKKFFEICKLMRNLPPQLKLLLQYGKKKAEESDD